MPVLVFAEGAEGEIRKSSYDAVGFASELAKKLGTNAVAIAIGVYTQDALSGLGKFGASKVLYVKENKLEKPLVLPYATAIAEAAIKENAEVVIMPKSSLVDAMASRIGIKLKAAIGTNVIELPDLSSGFTVKKPIYTGKAFTTIDLTSKIKVLTVAKNAFSHPGDGGAASVEEFIVTIPESDYKVSVKEIQKASGEISLTEADIVVSGGRGLKGPENWHLVTELAKALGAATGCSKPVSDLDWRPHHEHVGQTGVKVSPNVYIALGISGAIQHLAGVNSSKVIVVINKDPEAPFFKAADYGIVGDVFEIVPKLIDAAKGLK